MPLSRGLATAVINVINNDPECCRRINSVLNNIVPSRLGWTGSVRNYGYALAGTYNALAHGGFSAQPTAEEDDLVCYGIRDATIEALKKAMAKDKDRSMIGPLTGVGYVVRDNPIVHTATTVTVAGQWTYVFDWHATLDTWNPMLYPSPKAFEDNAGDRVVFSSFTGFTE